jgi:hypothetical protein
MFLDYFALGQLQPTGELLNPESRPGSGRAMAFGADVSGQPTESAAGPTRDATTFLL